MRASLMVRLGVATALLVSGGMVSAGVVYGIDDSNQIHRVDLNAKTDTVLVPAVGSPALTGTANGMALDLANNRLLFRSNDTGDLRAFNLSSQLITTVALAPLLPGSSASAAFYAGAYWYVQQGTDDLIKIDLTGTPSKTVFANFDGSYANRFDFGDIVITSKGILYGSSSQGFFSLDVSNPTAATFTLINDKTPQLQLALAADEKSIIAQQHGGANAGRWYDLSLTTGVATLIDGFPRTTPLRDITGVAIPEPTSVAMMGLGAVAVLGLASRRRKAA